MRLHGYTNDDIVFYFFCFIPAKWCCHSVSSLIINEGLKTQILSVKDLIVFES